MPLGFQRLNAKNSQPNERIVFIKPLKGPDEAIAQDFLERIAAQCLPIMKENHLSVMSLEEYEPNAEFVGRNFNAGEVVQLVLKARFTGHWLPFEYVQMVMMHELAHCKQMNHSRAFWAVRNQYAEHMRGLWSRGYTGEGLWGRGALLSTGEFERNGVEPGETLPEHLCGGTYRSRGKKRKAKKVISYQEQKEKRILKKFGANGVALGEDSETKRKLEGGKRIAAKPRVAGSARGRELRAAAALARFDQQKKEEVVTVDSDETESASEEDIVDAVDLNGKRLVDGKGRGMIKVCEDESPDDGDAQKELLELQGFSLARRPKVGAASSSSSAGGGKLDRASDVKPEVKEEAGAQSQSKVTDRIPQQQATLPAKKPEATKPPPAKSTIAKPAEGKSMEAKQTPRKQAAGRTEPKPAVAKPPEPKAAATTPSRTLDTSSATCSVCSFANDRMAPTCAICANVLHIKSMPGAWACSSQTCRGSIYRNAADCGVCGVCGERKVAAP
ncbi:WLM domain-containing protein [Cercophora newfieldiana]|uniref:WLM domain-containing protein n=1 Tax=Cercophora newfieldiana TaxID=92897 RepID=A0AA39YNC0_9PEZI|nr:WLM domain-containing protein [Cercophora newfieldiana]